MVVLRGDGRERRLTAYVTPRADEPAPGTAALRAHLARRLPEYMLPDAIVRLDRLPLNANGKVDRRALPAPERDPGASTTRTSARTQAEQALARIWGEVLGTSEVAVEDDFFALGGDSIGCIRVMSRARAAFGVELSPRVLFDRPTLAALAETVEEAVVRDLERMTDEEVEAEWLRTRDR